MLSFAKQGLGLAVILGVSVSTYATEWRYVVSSSSAGNNTDAWVYMVDVMLQTSGDSIARPTRIGLTPGGTQITVTIPEGSDTVFWKFESSPGVTFVPGEVVRKACRACSKDPGIDLMIADNPVFGSRSDTQAVSLWGNPYTYIRSASGSRGGIFTSYSDITFLKDVGTVYYAAGATGQSSGTWNNSFRLLRYNGMNIDSLWGSVLTGPVAIAPAARRHVAPRAASRRFDLHEMGIFLGRKAALDRAKPLPAGVK